MGRIIVYVFTLYYSRLCTATLTLEIVSLHYQKITKILKIIKCYLIIKIFLL